MAKGNVNLTAEPPDVGSEGLGKMGHERARGQQTVRENVKHEEPQKLRNLGKKTDTPKKESNKEKTKPTGL